MFAFILCNTANYWLLLVIKPCEFVTPQITNAKVKLTQQFVVGVERGTIVWSLNVAFSAIHPCHTAAILSHETKRALFYHAKPRNGNHGDEA